MTSADGYLNPTRRSVRIVRRMPRLLVVLLLVASLPFAAACGADDEGDAGGGQRVEVSATDFAFDPAEISADPGEITFALTNDGENPHALEIEGEGVDESSDTIDAGDTTDLTVELEEGTYEIYCPVGDHKDRGMVGTLTVGGGGAGGSETETETETETEETETGDTETGETETGETDTDSGGAGY
jgi:plastocyanin